ncbi:MAG: septum formation inhibitor Maf [Polaribacter sp.]
MKRMLNIYTPIICSFLFLFCTNTEVKKEENSSKKLTKTIEKHPKFNAYWYAGKAEITSYKLYQNRYGEIHEGTAVNIFVTEDFLPEKQVKADYRNEKNIPILKLNSTKKYVTGIYPYSLMTSTFSPINTNEKAIKISFSAQEWCGNTFVQLNNRKQFEIDFHSYFESNSDRQLSIKKDVLENELWNQLRINPLEIKKGRYKVIPSFEFLALNHKKIKAYDAEVNLIEKGKFMSFSIYYPELKRKLVLNLTREFPYIIESWEETFTQRGKTLTTKATKIKTIQSAYWSKNGVADVKERKELGL